MVELSMDTPRVRIGWLKMLLRVFEHHSKDGLYSELVADTKRLIAAAERELCGSEAPTLLPDVIDVPKAPRHVR